MHYEFTDEKKELRGMTAYRIRATEDIEEEDVEKGDLGGFVCTNSVLSRDSWVSGDACVWNSQLNGDIRVEDEAFVDNSKLKGRCILKQSARIEDSHLEGVSANGRARIRTSTFSVEKTAGIGFRVGGDAILNSCELRHTADRFMRIQILEFAKLENCTIKGKVIEFTGKSYFSRSNIEGEKLYFDAVQTADRLTLSGQQVQLCNISFLKDVEMKLTQSQLDGLSQLDNAHIEGDSIEIVGQDISIRYTKMEANFVKIHDSVNLIQVNLLGGNIELSDMVSLSGWSNDRITVGRRVFMKDLVSVHIEQNRKSLHFENVTLDGDIALSGI